MSRASSKVAYVVMQNDNPGCWTDGTEIHAEKVFFEDDAAEAYILSLWNEAFPEEEPDIEIGDWLWVERVDIG